MKISLTDVLAETGNRLDISEKLSLSDVNYLGDDISFKGVPTFVGDIYNNGKSLTLTGTADMVLGVQCARCRKPLEENFSFDVSETLVREGADGDEIVFSGDEIDLTDIVMNNFFLNVPAKFLCDDNCKGLCPTCGCDLNVSQCDCDKDIIDPRWEALKKIMDESKDD